MPHEAQDFAVIDMLGSFHLAMLLNRVPCFAQVGYSCNTSDEDTRVTLSKILTGTLAVIDGLTVTKVLQYPRGPDGQKT